jgi:hypothetical protein
MVAIPMGEDFNVPDEASEAEVDLFDVGLATAAHWLRSTSPDHFGPQCPREAWWIGLREGVCADAGFDRL